MQPTGHGIQPKNTTAMVMTGSWSVDDTKPTVQAAFRNKIPERFKTNGIFEIAAGEEGLLVDVKGEWGRAFFYRSRIQIPVMVPMNRVKTGAKWLPFHDKLARTELINPDINHNVQLTGDTVLNNYIRTIWSSLRQNQQALYGLGLSGRDGHATFGNNFVNNVNLITQGFTDRSRQLFSNGIATLDQIALLPRVTPTWPTPGTRCIYIRLYRRRQDGSIRYAIYAGQSVQHLWQRCMLHESDTQKQTFHYNVARQAAEQDRLMIPIIVWESNQAISLEIMNMAEQTVLLMFNTYGDWVLSSQFNAIDAKTHNQAVLMNRVSTLARSATNWPLYNAKGTNTCSPLFPFRTSQPFHCHRSPAKAGGHRGMTTYRQPRLCHPNPSGTFDIILCITHSSGTLERLVVTAPKQICRPDLPVYLIFEIMDDGKPHEFPYLGCPIAGPFEDFAVASSLAVAFEWFDEASNNWKKAYVAIKKFRSTFVDGVNNRDIMQPLASWRRCMDLIQLMEGIDYTGPFNGFSKSIKFAQVDVRELVVDHLTQTVTWRLRPRRSKPAPKIASFDHNARLLKAMIRGTHTAIGGPPDLESDFWRPEAGDIAAANRGDHQCDFCRFMCSTEHPRLCEKDNRFGDRWICKCCAVMNRPCTWTVRTAALRLWGEGQPFLVNHKSKFTSVPTGPYKHLAFHRSMSGSCTVVNTEEPIEGRNGFAVTMATEEDPDVQEELSGNVDVIGDDPEGED
ncbi:hypothetical protein HYE67_006747 [Fusarium culmorum]|uniref:Uncharacterized protein n=1 Tax=Fusarium culmorum TaxID=5516 RepID=A0A7S8D9M2_FUSCU|nr:hypothetical protein HYE67_006747 [Fusarium culmorum]